MTPFDSLAGIWWRRIPARAAIFPRVASALSDGSYLLAIPPLAALAVPAALVAGIWMGSAHPEDAALYTYSVTLMAAMAAIGSLATGLGVWLWIGYVFGDLVLFGPQGRPWDGLLISWLLLAALVIFIPQVASALSRGFARRSTTLAVAVRVLGTAGLVFLWTYAVPPVLRPIYGASGTDALLAVRPLQTEPEWIVLVAAIAARVHAAAEALGLRSIRVREARAEFREHLVEASRRGRRVPAWAAIPLQAGFVTLMLSGVITGTGQTLVTAGLAVATLGLRFVLGRVRPWTAAINRIPLLVRVVVIGLVTYYLAHRFIYDGVGNDFEPMLLSAGIGLALFALLSPARRRGGAPQERT